MKLNNNENTSSLGKIVIPVVASFTLGSWGVVSEIIPIDYSETPNAEINYLQNNPWEAHLLGHETMGGTLFFQNAMDDYFKLLMFGNNFLLDMEDVPLEFEKLFIENYWDLLA